MLASAVGSELVETTRVADELGETGGVTVTVEDALALVARLLAPTGLPESEALLVPDVPASPGTIPLFAITAKIVTGVLLVTLGAVKNPLSEMVPALADQVTAVLADPLMRAVNCNCCCDTRVALPGESEIPVESLAEEVDDPVVPV